MKFVSEKVSQYTDKIVSIGKLFTSNQFIKIISVPLILEIFCRVFRLPFFPAWTLLFHEKKTNGTNLFKLLIIISIECSFLGSSALEFGASVFASILILNFRQGKFRYLFFTIFATLLWSLLGYFTNKFPTGAMEIEVILTAILSRFTVFEIPAGFLSRFLLLSLTYFSIRFTIFIQQKLSGLFLLPLALVVFTDCADPNKEYFSPEKTENEVLIKFQKENEGETTGLHPILSADQIKNENCISCHSEKIAKTNSKRNKKSSHEIHYRPENMKLECIYCHENAGKENFGSEYPSENSRNSYNKKCGSCHTSVQNGSLKWGKKYL